MKSPFSKALVVVVGLAALAACAGAEDEDSPAANDSDLSAGLQLTCTGGGTTFDVMGASGTLDTGAFKTPFGCKQAAGGGVTCTEKLQKVHAGKWTAAVTKNGATYQATLDRGNLGPLTLDCTAPTPPAGPTYADVAPIIASTCGGCHQSQFGTLAALQQRHTQMLGAITGGAMPKNNPAWHLSADGQKVIAFLQGL
jgi:hypothetical protein